MVDGDFKMVIYTSRFVNVNDAFIFRSIHFETPLYYACEHGYYDIVKY